MTGRVGLRISTAQQHQAVDTKHSKPTAAIVISEPFLSVRHLDECPLDLTVRQEVEVNSDEAIVDCHDAMVPWSMSTDYHISIKPSNTHDEGTYRVAQWPLMPVLSVSCFFCLCLDFPCQAKMVDRMEESMHQYMSVGVCFPLPLFGATHKAFTFSHFASSIPCLFRWEHFMRLKSAT